MPLIFQTLVHSYRQHFLKGLFVALALISGIAGLSSVLVINATAKQSYESATPPLFEQLQFRIKAKPGDILTKQDYVKGRKEGIAWVPVVQFETQLRQGWEATLIAIDPFALNISSQIIPDNSIQEMGNLILSRAFASELGLRAGDSVVLATGETLGTAMISDQSIQDGVILLDIALMLRLFKDVNIDEFWLFNTPSDSQLQHLQSQYQVESIVFEDPATLTDSFHLNLLAMGLLMFIVCLFIVMNAFNLLYADRKPMLVILRQMGVSRRRILKAISIELMVLCFFCSLLGTLLGVQLAMLLSPAVELTLTSLYEVSLSWRSASIGSIFVITFLASLAGAFTATLNPLMSLNNELANIRAHQQENASSNKVWMGLALFFSFSYGLSLMLSTNLLGHFISVAILILLGCSVLILVIPVLLRLLLNLVPNRQALLSWAVSDALRIARHSKIAMCAFFIAVTANVGMNLMVDSFRHATLGWLEQRLVADYFLSTNNPEAVSAYFQEQHAELWLWERKRLYATINGQAVDVIAYPEQQAYKNAVGFKESLEEAWTVFLQDGAFINEQLALQHGLGLGDKVRFYAADQIFTRTIAGIHYDYGNMDKQILVPSRFIENSEATRFLFAIHVPEDHHFDFETIASEIRAFDETSSISDLKQLMTFSMMTFDKAFVVTGALNIITLMVAAISLATSITIIEVQNSPQSGLMRSLGVGKVKLIVLSMLQYAMLALLSCLVAVPFGTMLSSILINKINVTSFFWSYPLMFSSEIVIQVVLASIMIVLLAVLLPLWRNQSQSIAQRLTQL